MVSLSASFFDWDSVGWCSCVTFLIRQWPINVDVYIFILQGCLIFCSILDFQFDFFHQNIGFHVFIWFNLDLNNEKVLTRHIVGFRVNRALQHLKLSLGTNLDSLLDMIWPIFEGVRHVHHVHEIRNVALFYLVLVVFQFLMVTT